MCYLAALGRFRQIGEPLEFPKKAITNGEGIIEAR